MSVAIKITAADLGYRHVRAIQNLSIEIQGGESCALVGGNGSGKSTILKTLAGLIPALDGSVEVMGGAPGKSPDRVAYLGQVNRSSEVLPLRVFDVVRMGRYAHLGLFRRFDSKDEAIVEQSLADVGIADLADKSLRDLSGGQKQRVFLAQTLARRASVLLLDEPTNNLDASAVEILGSALASVSADGATTVIATHDIEEARAADLVVLLGTDLTEVGKPQVVLTENNLAAASYKTAEPHAHGGHPGRPLHKHA